MTTTQFHGPCYAPGDKVRVKQASLPIFSRKLSRLDENLMTVTGVAIKNVNNTTDGMPYTDRFSYQVIILKEIEGECAADHFEPA